jgi:murein DD-endopeptidase MepM/ murein hydrolase activator NlpD
MTMIIAACAELPTICIAAPFSSPASLSGLALLSPVANACISSPFGPRRRIGPHAPAAFHRGVDLPAPAGGAVSAVAAGHVVGIHRLGPGGLQVTVRHDGYTAIYAHLGRVTPGLAEGRTRLAAGQPIGVVGRTGVTYGTHLYFEILVNGQPVDPGPMLGLSHCALKIKSFP